MQCAKTGKHVLLEKPIEGTLARSEELVKLCGNAGVRLGIVFQNRCRTPHIRLRELLRAGTLGEIISAAVMVRWWRTESYFQEPGRGIKHHDGGGVLFTQAIHMMDQLSDRAGVPEQITGFAATSKLRRIDTEDVFASPMRWTNGALGVLYATTTHFPTTGETLDIAASLGVATLERTRLRVWLKDGQTIDVAEDPDDPAVAKDYLTHRRLIADMDDAIAQHRAPIADGSGSLGVHRVIEALLRSANSGAAELVT